MKIDVLLNKETKLNLQLLFFYAFSILSLRQFVLVALFYTAFRTDSVSLFRYPLLSPIKVMLIILRNSLSLPLNYPYSCVAFRTDSVSLFRYPLLSPIKVMLIILRNSLSLPLNYPYSCVAFRTDSVSLFRYPLLSPI